MAVEPGGGEARTRTNHETTREVRLDTVSGSAVEAIVGAVSRIRNVEPTELPPLGRSVDAELLERLTDPSVVAGAESGHLTFSYVDVTVTVDLDGTVRFEWE